MFAVSSDRTDYREFSNFDEARTFFNREKIASDNVTLFDFVNDEVFDSYNRLNEFLRLHG